MRGKKGAKKRVCVPLDHVPLVPFHANDDEEGRIHDVHCVTQQRSTATNACMWVQRVGGERKEKRIEGMAAAKLKKGRGTNTHTQCVGGNGRASERK